MRKGMMLPLLTVVSGFGAVGGWVDVGTPGGRKPVGCRECSGIWLEGGRGPPSYLVRTKGAKRGARWGFLEAPFALSGSFGDGYGGGRLVSMGGGQKGVGGGLTTTRRRASLS